MHNCSLVYYIISYWFHIVFAKIEQARGRRNKFRTSVVKHQNIAVISTSCPHLSIDVPVQIVGHWRHHRIFQIICDSPIPRQLQRRGHSRFENLIIRSPVERQEAHRIIATVYYYLKPIYKLLRLAFSEYSHPCWAGSRNTTAQIRFYFSRHFNNTKAILAVKFEQKSTHTRYVSAITARRNNRENDIPMKQNCPNQ